jgi:hypothetical protein
MVFKSGERELDERIIVLFLLLMAIVAELIDWDMHLRVFLHPPEWALALFS